MAHSASKNSNTGLVTLVGVATDEESVRLIEAVLPHAMHLRPQWDRMLWGPFDDQVIVGLPIGNKVTRDTIENHSRHFYSLLSLLGTPLVSSPMQVESFEVERETLQSVVPLVVEDE